MRFRHSLLSCAVALTLLTGVAAHADTLLVNRVQKEKTFNLPTRGMSMSQVEQRYGAPNSKLPPAGGDSQYHPVINRWVYFGYTVYFEGNHVIDAVANRASPNEIGPKKAQ